MQGVGRLHRDGVSFTAAVSRFPLTNESRTEVVAAIGSPMASYRLVTHGFCIVRRLQRQVQRAKMADVPSEKPEATPDIADNDADDGKDEGKGTKKRYALIVSYVGAGFSGLQVQPSKLQRHTTSVALHHTCPFVRRCLDPQ